MITETKDQATPRPWKYLDQKDGTADVYQLKDGYSSIGTVIGQVASRDADLIVRAVNSYDALVEACEKIIDAWNRNPGLHDIPSFIYAHESATEALTLAKGE